MIPVRPTACGWGWAPPRTAYRAAPTAAPPGMPSASKIARSMTWRWGSTGGTCSPRPTTACGGSRCSLSRSSQEAKDGSGSRRPTPVLPFTLQSEGLHEQVVEQREQGDSQRDGEDEAADEQGREEAVVELQVHEERRDQKELDGRQDDQQVREPRPHGVDVVDRHFDPG